MSDRHDRASPTTTTQYPLGIASVGIGLLASSFAGSVTRSRFLGSDEALSFSNGRKAGLIAASVVVSIVVGIVATMGAHTIDALRRSKVDTREL